MTPEEIEAARLEAERLEAERLEANKTQPSDTEKLFLQTMQENERFRREAEQRARNAEDELQKLRGERNTPPANTGNNISAQQFFDDPVTHMTRLIAEQVAPLRATAAQLEVDRNYNALKQQYRMQYPAFAQIEGSVDEIMRGQEPTHANMSVAIERAIGRAVANNPDFFRPKGEAPPNGGNNNSGNAPPPAANSGVNDSRLPAHLRPSNSSSNVNDQKPKRRALTELEHRVRREMNMTEEQYLDNLEADSRVEGWKPKSGGK